MFEYFAGKYFIHEGLMTREQYNEIFAGLKALEVNILSRSKNVKYPENNLLENNHIALIHLLQNALDEKIGDLAFEYEGAKDEQLKSLVRTQQELNTLFFNRLILEGILTPDILSPELEKMRSYYALNASGISRNLREDFDGILSGFVKTKDYYAKEYAIIALKYILRFVGTRIRFDECHNVFGYSSERIALQKIVTKENRYFIGISGEKSVLQRFNDNIENSFTPLRRDSRYGSLLSFLNCVTNILQCIIARENEVVLVDMANVYKYSTILVNEYCFVIPLLVEDMKLNLTVGYGVKPNFATISHNI